MKYPSLDIYGIWSFSSKWVCCIRSSASLDFQWHCARQHLIWETVRAGEVYKVKYEWLLVRTSFFSNIFNSHCLHQWYLFFSVFRYQNVLFVCGLQPDLLLLANGDETEVTPPPHTHTSTKMKSKKNKSEIKLQTVCFWLCYRRFHELSFLTFHR